MRELSRISNTIIYILAIVAVEILKYKVEEVKGNFHGNYMPWGILVSLHPLKRSGHHSNQFSSTSGLKINYNIS